MRLLKLAIVCTCFCQIAVAQNTFNSSDFQYKKNLIKVNLTSPIIKNYSLQYERVINKYLSVALSGRIMPATTTPFKAAVKRKVLEGEVNNELVNDIIDQMKFSNYAITPEVRFYLGKKGYGRGFYIAPYYRFAEYKLLKNTISFDEDGENYSVDVEGKVRAHTGGLLLGAQWMLGKNIGLDLWLLGPNIGGGKGTATGVSNTPLDADEQADLKRNLEDISTPYTRETVEVNANGGKMEISGPWAGIRAGLLFTFRF